MTKKAKKGPKKRMKASNENAETTTADTAGADAAAGDQPETSGGKRQQTMPGMERKTIAEIETAAEAYRKARDARMALTKKETEKQADLLDVMRRHDVTSYVYEDDDGEEMSVKVDDIVKVKVKKLKNVDADDE